MALETSADSPAPLRQISSLLNGYIGRLGAVWLEAEVVQPKASGAMYYLTLRDLEAKISINAVAFRGVIESSPTPITDGTRVVVHAKPDFYEPRGSLSLRIQEIRPTGEGELLAQLERRKQLLAAEGLFEQRHKRPLPTLPLGIGVVTGRGSAAERDVVQNVQLRWPAAPLHLAYALMQGPKSAEEVIAATRAFDADPGIDVIVIARGGGSLEDLLPFSDEALVRAVFACSTPVVSAIGHEPDVPILDLVADLRASTPTDAAKRIVPDEASERAGLADAIARLRAALTTRIDAEALGLSQLRSRPVLANPATVIDAQQEGLTVTLGRARAALGRRLDVASDEIGHHLARVRGLSPLATLERGYAVALGSTGQAITQIEQAPIDTELTLTVTDGRITARVITTESTKPNEGNDA
jgi:exodeoxyribonuclease VII large subunit